MAHNSWYKVGFDDYGKKQLQSPANVTCNSMSNITMPSYCSCLILYLHALTWLFKRKIKILRTLVIVVV